MTKYPNHPLKFWDYFSWLIVIAMILLSLFKIGVELYKSAQIHEQKIKQTTNK
ncbi:hypothetical protein ACVWYN_002717 [Pedobacter sp. UYP24]